MGAVHASAGHANISSVRWRIRCGAALLALSSGCSDQVVGYFDDTLSLAESSTGGEPLSTSFTPVTDSGSSSGPDGDASESEGSTGPGGALGPCMPFITDTFDGPDLDESLWFTWAELDSAWLVQGGQMVFTPPTARHPDNAPADTGLVSTPDHLVPDDNFAIRMEVVTAPLDENPVLLYFMLLDSSDQASVSMKVRPVLSITGSEVTGVENYDVQFEDIVAPRWIGMAFIGDEVHYQVSDDGIDWTTVHVGPMISAILEPRTLVMVQTLGDVPLPPNVVVDNYSICKF